MQIVRRADATPQPDLRTRRHERTATYVGEYDGLPPADIEPPSWAQAEFADSACIVAFDFAKAAHSQADAWWHLSHACLRLDTLARQRGQNRLTEAQQGRLSNSIRQARDAFAIGPHVDMIGHGFDAVDLLVASLAESERGQHLAPHRLTDAFDRVRILRNHAHSESLLQEIAARAAMRRTLVLAQMMTTCDGVRS